MISLVTGGAGFIGSNLVNRLLQIGHEVIVVDNESAECHNKFYWNDKAQNYKYDVCNFELVSSLFNKIDYVFHMASDARVQPSILNPLNSIKTNIIGISNILELSRLNNVKRVIFSSSSSIYGNNLTPNIETQNPDPLTPYSAAKLAGENLCKIYHELYGLKTISLRYFNVYGDNQPTKGQYAPVIGLFLKQKSINKPLTVVGDGNQVRSFTHINDIIDANIASINKDIALTNFGEVYNIGSNKKYSILELAKVISDNIIYIDNRMGESVSTFPDISKAKDILKWYPKIDILDWLKTK